MAKKILITTESLCMGGVETSLLSFIKMLKKYDVEIDLFVLEEGELSLEFKKLTKVNKIPIKLPKNKLIYRILKNVYCNSLYKKFKKIQTKKYDIAISYYDINNYSAMYVAASNAKEKYIWIHNNFETAYNLSNYKIILKMRNLIMKRKFKYFDYIVSVSDSAKNGFNHIFKGFQNMLLVINNLFDMDRIKNKNEKCDLKGKNKLIYIGRLEKIKNVEGLIDEFAKVIPKFKDTYLYIIGSGTDEERLKKITMDKHLNSNIIFLGNQKNPFKYLNKADALVLTSKSESYGMVLYEALAMKKYFISTDTYGAKEIFYNINNGNIQNGVVCNLENIHNEIIKFLKNKDKIKPCFDINKANEKIEKQTIDILKIN